MATSVPVIILSEENTSSPEEEGVRTIPEELRDEILARLPIKSVLRFKSVCKTWCSLFRSRSFVDLHCQRYSRDKYEYDHIEKISKEDLIKIVPTLSCLPLPPKTLATLENKKVLRSIRVYGPLNNSIYCISSHINDRCRFLMLDGKIALCNPATHDYKFTNPFPPDTHSLLSGLFSKNCLLHLGFGSVHKPTCLDYKVVIIVHSIVRVSCFVSFVYSLRSGEWKKIVDYETGKRDVVAGGDRNAFTRTIQGRVQYPYIPVDLELCPQRFFNGCWHWMARFRHGWGDYSYSLLSFNFGDDSFKLLGEPQCYNDYHTDGELNREGKVLVLDDHLAAVYLFKTKLDVRCVDVDVWMMMEYGVEESWTRIYKIKPNFSGSFLRLLGVATPLRPLRSGTLDDRHPVGLVFEDNDKHGLVFEDDDNHLVYCHEGRNSVRGFHYDTSSFIFWNSFGISTYMETLEPI